MRFIISAPGYSSKSAGIMVEYELQKYLIRRGHDAHIFLFGVSYTDDCIDVENDIVIYPEIIDGNPYKAKKVVRYLLNTPGVIGGDPKTYGKNDYYIAYNKHFKKDKNTPLLTVPYIPPYFKPSGCRRIQNAIWVGKGHWKHKIPMSKETVVITYTWPEKKKELAILLQSCHTLFTYDDKTGLAEEAKACGCVVKVINEDGTFSDYEHEEWGHFEKQLDRFLLDMEEWK